MTKTLFLSKRYLDFMENFLNNPNTIYLIGIAVTVLFALIWSFLLDKNKPHTVKEFIAKLIARGLFIAFFFIVIVGFFYLALGVGYDS